MIILLDFFNGWTFWHWWGLAAALLALEIFAPSTFLIWPAASAAVMGLLVLIFGDFNIWVQLLLYGILSGITTVAWFRWFKGREAEEEPSTLNARTGSNVGRKIRLREALADGAGRMSMDDTWWSARSTTGKTVPQGTLVEIVGSESTVLLVTPEKE